MFMIPDELQQATTDSALRGTPFALYMYLVFGPLRPDKHLRVDVRQCALDIDTTVEEVVDALSVLTRYRYLDGQRGYYRYRWSNQIGRHEETRRVAAGPVTPDTKRNTGVRKAAVARCKGKCEGCGLAVGRYVHVHHIWPLGRGGPDNLDNLIGLCPTCHIVAHSQDGNKSLPWSGAKTRDEMMAFLARERDVALQPAG